MNNSKSIASLSASTMEQFKTDINVSMNDVVNVFVERYETDLINKRTSNQSVLKILNKQIQDLVDVTMVEAKSFVTQSLTTPKIETDLFTITVSIDEDDFKLDWTRGTISYNIDTKIVSATMKSGDYRSYNSNSIGGIFMIGQHTLDQYKGLMEQKTNVLAVLAEINNNLRDVSRKERQVRAKLSEQKLADMGMQDLLSNPDMLMLIDTSSIDDVIG